MENKEKEIERLCKEALANISHVRRGQMGSSYFHFNDEYAKKALDLARKAVKLSQNKSVEALRVSGYIYYLIGYDRDALHFYKKAYAIEPENPIILFNLALYYHNAEKDSDLDKAFEFITKAIDKKPKNQYFWSNLSNILLSKLKKDPNYLPTFLEYHFELLELFPHSSEAIKNMGTIYYEQKDFAEAIKYYEKYTIKHPRKFNELMLLGNAYREVGDIDNAIKTYETYLENNTKSKEAKKILFELLTSQGYRIASADNVRSFIRNKSIKDRKARELCIKADLLIKQGDAVGAIEILHEALKKNPRNIDAQVYLGISSVILGDV